MVLYKVFPYGFATILSVANIRKKTIIRRLLTKKSGKNKDFAFTSAKAHVAL